VFTTCSGDSSSLLGTSLLRNSLLQYVCQSTQRTIQYVGQLLQRLVQYGGKTDQRGIQLAHELGYQRVPRGKGDQHCKLCLPVYAAVHSRGAHNQWRSVSADELGDDLDRVYGVVVAKGQAGGAFQKFFDFGLARRLCGAFRQSVLDDSVLNTLRPQMLPKGVHGIDRHLAEVGGNGYLAPGEFLRQFLYRLDFAI